MTVIHARAEDALGQFAPGSVDAMVTDPPAGIGFMGKDWDGDKGGRDAWIAWFAGVMSLARAAMKPGAYGLIWALPRTSHWTATGAENAGFEIQDVHHVEWGDDSVPTALEARAARNSKSFDGDGCSAETIAYLDGLGAQVP